MRGFDTSVAVATLLATCACAQPQSASDDSSATGVEPAASSAPIAGVAQRSGRADKAVFGYYLGLPIQLFAEAPPFLGGTGPAAPSRGTPDLVVYLTAPTSEGNYTAPSAMIPTPQGRRWLPPHEDTLARFVTEEERADALGYFIIAGPRATPERVRVTTDPNQPDTSLYASGAPLAREIKVGEQWLPLNSHVVIEYGLRNGLLAAKYFDYGGLMWARAMDPTAEPLPDTDGAAPPVRLPPQTP